MESGIYGILRVIYRLGREGLEFATFVAGGIGREEKPSLFGLVRGGSGLDDFWSPTWPFLSAMRNTHFR